MELESIVANSKYTNAKLRDESQGRSRRWRRMLTFPLIGECRKLEEYLQGKGHLDWLDVIQQPIGRKEFTLFCNSNRAWASMVCFLQDLERYEDCTEDQCLEMAWSIFNEFLSSSQTLCDLMETDVKADIMRQLVAQDATEGLFIPCARVINTTLATEAFPMFRASAYYTRFLQWKLLEYRPINPKIFRPYRILGKGGFGEVFACQSRETGKMYACKRMDKKRIKKKKAEDLAVNERKLLGHISSKFVVGLSYAYCTKTDLFLVCDLVNSGDLRFHIQQSNGFSEKRARFYAAQILLGLQDLHSARILYRDLKPENVLLDGNGNVRLSDLGLSIWVPPKKAARGRVGTAGYMAPEILRGDRYRASCDWWAFGCIVFEMLEGHGPFRNHPKKRRIKSDDLDERALEHNPEYRNATPAAKALCKGLLQKDVTKRLGCGGSPCAKCDPEKIKTHEWFKEIDWVKLRDGSIDPPFVPDATEVYAADVLELHGFSEAQVKLKPEDHDVYRYFEGASCNRWQQDMLDTVFDELNPFPFEELPKEMDPTFRDPVATRFQKMNPFVAKPPKRPQFDRRVVEARLKTLVPHRESSVYFKAQSVAPKASKCSAAGYENMPIGTLSHKESNTSIADAPLRHARRKEPLRATSRYMDLDLPRRQDSAPLERLDETIA